MNKKKVAAAALIPLAAALAASFAGMTYYWTDTMNEEALWKGILSAVMTAAFVAAHIFSIVKKDRSVLRGLLIYDAAALISAVTLITFPFVALGLFQPFFSLFSDHFIVGCWCPVFLILAALISAVFGSVMLARKEKKSNN